MNDRLAFIKHLFDQSPNDYHRAISQIATLQTWEEATINKDSQKTGAAPNIVHSFDAAHLTMTVVSAPYEMTVVHDSFGTLPGRMDDLFYRVREQFVEFYKSKPLEKLLSELNCKDLIPERGNLDVGQIVYSDYAFC